MLRADWLTKHRQHRPAVACVFFSREAVLGESTCGAVCTALENVRAAVRRRNASLVAVVVGGDGAEPLPEERISALCRRGALDSRYVVCLAACDSPAHSTALRRLALVLQDASAAFYRAEGIRAASKTSPRLVSETSVRTAWKAAVFAEFRQDWAAALQFYRAAYQAVTELPIGPADARRWQRWYERLIVAEHAHYKCCTLLMHTGVPGEAITQLHRHLAHHRRPPSGLPPALRASLWGYLQRQFRTFGELLMSPPLNQTERPAAYFAAAANAGLRRRQVWTAYAEAHEVSMPVPPPTAAGMYVGQQRREPVGPALSDEEFTAWLAHCERPSEYSHVNLELLTRAHALFKRSPGSNRRVLTALLSQMADEYLCNGDSASALRLLQSVAAVYRHEGWSILLADALSSLRECARRLSLPAEHTEWSAELGSLPSDGGAPLAERSAVLASALATLDNLVESDSPVLLSEAAALCVACFTKGAALPGEPLLFLAALRPRCPLSFELQSAAVELEAEGQLSVQELTLGDVHPDGWRVCTTQLAAPATATLCARSVLLRAGPRVALRCTLAGQQASAADADPLPPASLLSSGAAHLTRLGGLPGALRVSLVLPPPSATLSIRPPAHALAGQLVELDITVCSVDDALQSPSLHLKFGSGAVPELFRRGPVELERLEGVLSWEDMQPHSEVTHHLLLCSPDACAAQLLTAMLECRTARGSASLEGVAQLPATLSPFVTTATFTGALEQHSLLPSSGACVVLPRGEALVLSARVLAGGAVTVHSLDFQPADGWSAQVRARPRSPAPATADSRACGQPLTPIDAPCALSVGDVLTRLYTVTASMARERSSAHTLSAPPSERVTQEAVDAVPGHLAVRWEASEAHARCPAVLTRLPLPLVSVEEPPVHVRTRWPADFVVGQPATVGVAVENRTPLPQELGISVADSAGFVFAGERASIVTILPYCTAEVRHTFVAHVAGWQPVPEVAVMLKRYSARLAPSPDSRLVCVRPPGSLTV